MDTVVLAPAGYLLDPDIGSDYERPWRLAEGLARRGLRVVVVAREVKRMADLGPNVELARPPGSLPTSPVGRIADRANLYWYARLISRREVSAGRALVVHHLGPCGEYSPSLIAKLPIPFVYGPLPASRPPNIPDDEWLSWLRTPNATAAQATLSRVAAVPARIAAHFLWLRMIRRADAVIVESAANAPPERPDAVVIPPGVNVTLFSPDKRDDPIPGRVMAVGNLLGRKGYDVLIRAIARVARTRPQAHLVLAGSGPDELSLRRLAGQLGIDSSVTFAGNVPRADLPRLLRSSEVFSHPATFDTFPLALLEAMACGLPTVVSSAGALPDIVGRAGLVHPVGDDKQLAQSLLQVLSSAELRRSLGAAARARAVKTYTWQAMSDSYLELYRELADTKVKLRPRKPVP
jgi:glycosyltransferase involved in cell wall biosynthesis